MASAPSSSQRNGFMGIGLIEAVSTCGCSIGQECPQVQVQANPTRTRRRPHREDRDEKRLRCPPPTSHGDSVAVPVVQIGVVRVFVRYGDVAMRVSMRLRSIPGEVVWVLMMLVVRVRMRVLERLMRMRVLVAFAQMQP